VQARRIAEVDTMQLTREISMKLCSGSVLHPVAATCRP
jgi:hypothetical protein